MIGKIPDTKIKITIKPGTENDGYPWVARSGTKPKIIAGGPTAQDALKKFVSVLAEQEEIPLSQIGWDVIGVQAVAALYINRENRTLTEFGPAAEAPGTSELVCTVTEEDYYDEVDEPTEDEEIELPGKTCAKCWYFHFPIGNLPSRCNRYGTPASAEDIVCANFKPLFIDELLEHIKKNDPIYGISLPRDDLDLIIQEFRTWIFVPGNTTHAPKSGNMILVYEKGKRKGFVGRFVAGEVVQLERDAAMDPVWKERLHMSDEEIAERFGTSINQFVIQICDYYEFLRHYDVPAGEKAPRGMNWLPKAYLEKLFHIPVQE